MTPFAHRTTVRFHHVDRAGIAFFGRVFELCHDAFEELLVDAGTPLVGLLEAEGWGLPLVHAEADYAAPMRIGDRLTIEAHVARLGRTSVTFRYAVTGADDGVRRATVTHVHAAIDLKHFKPMPVPEFLRDALAAKDLIAEPADG